MPRLRPTTFLTSLLFFLLLPSAQGQKPPLTLDEFFNAVYIGSVQISPDGHAVVVETNRADWAAQRFRDDLWLYRDDEATAYLQQVLQADPNAILARGQLVMALERKQRYEEALAERKQLAASEGDSGAIEAYDRGYARGGYRAAMRARGDLAVQRSQRNYVAPTEVAGYYASAGEKELALDWLEKGYREHQSEMVRIKSNPRWDNLSDHPRFKDLLRRMNLPE